FCKHCVAVALVFLYHAEHGTLARVADEPGDSGDLAGYLTGLAHAELVDLLLDATERDPALGQRLALRAAAAPWRVGRGHRAATGRRPCRVRREAAARGPASGARSVRQRRTRLTRTGHSTHTWPCLFGRNRRGVGEWGELLAPRRW